jgi:glycerol kinase
LPEIKPSIGKFGTTEGIECLPHGIPILGVLGDQQAALFGQNCTMPGQAKITFGTGAFLLMNIGEKPIFSTEGLLTTVAYSTSQKRTFALEGSAFVAGAAVQFLRDNFGWLKNSAESEAMATRVPRDDSLLFVPSLAGLGAPYWNPHAKGVLFGLTRGSQKEQIVRAVLESIALQNVQLLRLMESISAQKLALIGIDGGGARNDFLMQFQSDVLGTNLVRPNNIETTSVGAARAARMGLLEKETEIEDEKGMRSFIPQMPKDAAEENLNRWLAAVECVNQFYGSKNP